MIKAVLKECSKNTLTLKFNHILNIKIFIMLSLLYDYQLI